jgi:hypothetical protein
MHSCWQNKRSSTRKLLVKPRLMKMNQISNDLHSVDVSDDGVESCMETSCEERNKSIYLFKAVLPRI